MRRKSLKNTQSFRLQLLGFIDNNHRKSARHPLGNDRVFEQFTAGVAGLVEAISLKPISRSEGAPSLKDRLRETVDWHARGPPPKSGAIAEASVEPFSRSVHESERQNALIRFKWMLRQIMPDFVDKSVRLTRACRTLKSPERHR
jgi:hypothetical protein